MCVCVVISCLLFVTSSVTGIDFTGGALLKSKIKKEGSFSFSIVSLRVTQNGQTRGASDSFSQSECPKPLSVFTEEHWRSEQDPLLVFHWKDRITTNDDSSGR